MESIPSEEYQASQRGRNDRNIETAVGIHVGSSEIGNAQVLSPKDHHSGITSPEELSFVRQTSRFN